MNYSYLIYRQTPLYSISLVQCDKNLKNNSRKRVFGLQFINTIHWIVSNNKLAVFQLKKIVLKCIVINRILSNKYSNTLNIFFHKIITCKDPYIITNIHQCKIHTTFLQVTCMYFLLFYWSRNMTKIVFSSSSLNKASNVLHRRCTSCK